MDLEATAKDNTPIQNLANEVLALVATSPSARNRSVPGLEAMDSRVVIVALIQTAAFIAATSKVCGTPGGRKDLTEYTSRKFRSALNDARKVFDAGEYPIGVVTLRD